MVSKVCIGSHTTPTSSAFPTPVFRTFDDSFGALRVKPKDGRTLRKGPKYIFRPQHLLKLNSVNVSCFPLHHESCQ